jgi:hypothetical protein
MTRRTLWSGGAAALVVASLAIAPGAQAAPPPNDAFASAARLEVPPAIQLGTIAEATREEGEPQHAPNATGPTVWYFHRAERTERLALSTCSTRFDTVLAVYTGETLGSLTPVAANDDACGNLGSRVTFVAQAGTVYRIAVGGFREAAGDAARFHLLSSPVVRPRNDAFGAPQPIALGFRAIVPTSLATAQRGEPAHHGRDRASHSVWFTYRARRTGTVKASTFGSSFDTILAVYRGNRFGQLTKIGSSDDLRGQTLASRVRWRAQRGATYRIVVDGYRTRRGEAVLTLSR